MDGTREACVTDADRMAELAELKREQYREHAPAFHRPKPGVRDLHAAFLGTQVANHQIHIALVHETSDRTIDGFLIATMIPAPPVYDPGGLTCLVDDFMVETPTLWASVGRSLLDEVVQRSVPKGAVQTVVVCGPHDTAKRAMLFESGHIVASEWFTRPFADPT